MTMVEIVETAFKVSLKYPSPFSEHQVFIDSLNRIMAASFWSESIRGWFKTVFPLWLQCHFHYILPDSIYDYWDA